ncbi:MarR family transcriptional regulator [Streptomyces sp. JJ36]|uniref:MarR family transcriptional regulator n=1 Tax=Streptomyces sp. JJ36 TaxID=2736645 RepID=UPI001F301D4E|nr:MarR family transcriptional regulator [Streptomyces sp. JJ36]MCF6521713.1 MarR family transcriptional regulator [Streptomyces sp. JJ36]
MGDDALSSELIRLGLAGPDIGVYRELLRSGPAPRADLARRLGRSPGEVAGSAARLIELGLLATVGPDEDGLTPVEPTLALEYLAGARTAEIQGARLAALNAYRDFRRTVHPQPTEDLLEVVTGPQIVERIHNIEKSARHEVMRFDSPPYHTGGGPNPIEIDGLGRGVAYRVVYAKSAVRNPDYYAENIQPCIAAGEQARALPTVPVKLTVFDRKVAIVSMTFVGEDLMEEESVAAENNDSMLVVHPSSLLSALTGLFESSWKSAFPLHFGDRIPSALTPIQGRILELLGSGLTDETMAGLLGVSRRTLSRHLMDLHARAGSTTRFQLALHAAREGWI